MTLQDFEKITGTTVKPDQALAVTTQIKRAQTILENLLGFTLDPDKTMESSLSGATGAYRLYVYYPYDEYIHVDPFSTLHSVKLVKLGETVHTFDAEDYGVELLGGWNKYIRQLDPYTSSEAVQLAVDADWLWKKVGDDPPVLPSDIALLWAEMATYYGNPKRDIRSESIGPHSFSKFEAKVPYELPEHAKVLRKYAGPHGAITRMPV